MAFYDQVVLADGPSLFWPSITTTTATDASGNGRNGTIAGSPTTTVASPVTEPSGDTDTGLDLDGSNDYISSSYNPFTNGTARTFEGWAWRDSNGSHDMLFGSAGSGSELVTLNVLGGGNDVNFDPRSDVGAAGVNWAGAWPGTGQWVHWAFIFDEANDTGELFINGVSKGVQAVTDAYGATPGNFMVGAYQNTQHHFDGKMQKVAVYEYVLTPQQVAFHYDARDFTTAPVSVPTAGPGPLPARVLLKALDGKWEPLGIDRLRGLTPEGITASANEWGSDRFSCVVKRSPNAVWPDMSAFTDLEYHEDGMLVWSGRVAETPTTDGTERQIALEGEGWQYHLDDDVYQRNYVHTQLSDWRDNRSFDEANLTFLTTAWETSADGQIYLSLPQNNTATSGSGVAVVLDTGEEEGCKRVVLTYKGGGGASMALRIAGCSVPPAYVGASVDNYEAYELDATPITTSLTTVAQTFSVAHRYVQIGVASTALGTLTGSDVHWCRITDAQVFRETAYESGNASVLKADTVMKDARDAATTQLSLSDEKVEAQTFSIPAFSLAEARTPREVIEAVNAYEDLQTAVNVRRQLVVRDRPSAPLVEVGSRSGHEFEDAAANDGDNIYNVVRVEGTGPDGQPLRVTRTSSDLSDASYARSSIQLSNPGFETDTSNWTVSHGTLTRDTGVFGDGVASGRITAGTNGFGLISTVSITSGLTPNRRYRLEFQARPTASCSVIAVATNADSYAAQWGGGLGPALPAVGSFSTLGVDFTAESASAFFGFLTSGTASVDHLYLDAVTLYEPATTLVDRRGFSHTKVVAVASPGTEDSYEQLGDIFLTNHRTTPLKGKMKITSKGGARRVLGGQPVHPAHLLTQTGEKIRLSNRIDPDTGGMGRDARMVDVTFNRDTMSAEISLDSNRSRFEALLSRLAVVTGRLLN